jgi:alpha-glucosidase
MNVRQVKRLVATLKLAAVLVFMARAAAGQSTPASAVETLRGPCVAQPLVDGIHLHCANAVMQLTALTDDVLRVRIGRGDALHEDASWAVLAAARQASAHVQAEAETGWAGFSTHALRVRVDLASLALTVTDLAGNVVQQDQAGWPIEYHGDTFRMYKSIPADEHYFGLGDKPGGLDRRGHAYSMWNTDAYSFQESSDEIYKTLPFFMTFRAGRAAGVLFDNTFRSSFDFGQQTASVFSFGAEGGPIDYYLLAGPMPKDVLRQYGWLTGFAPLPPMWALGYQQSRSSYYPQERVEEVADRLRTERIPADALYLDIDYQQSMRPFTVDEQRFPHFAELLADLKQKDFRVIAITDMHIANTPGEDYAPYVSGVAGDHFLRSSDGSRYVGKVWPGDSVFPEFTDASARAWWGSLYQRFVHDGVAGFWDDMNEPAIFGPTKTMPETVRHRIGEPGFTARTATHAEVHNVYGMLNSRATYEGVLALRPDERPFVLTRATYPGGQRYAWTWTGDNASSWNHLRLTTPMLLNLGLSGFSLSGADVGGFSGVPDAALLTKWFEVAAFQPLFREHSSRKSGDREPWIDGPTEEATRRRFIETRYRLMPYLYTAADELSRTGVPILRPLFVEYPHAAADGHAIDLDAGGEFLFGPDLLVAPPPYPEQQDTYEVKLPPGNWFDFWTGLPVQRATSTPASKPGQKEHSAEALTAEPKPDSIPVYVRGGAIVPMAPLTQSTMQNPVGPLTLAIYPGDDCHGSVYIDDGVSFAYRRGAFARIALRCEVTEHSLVLHIGTREGTFPVWWSRFAVEVHGMTEAPHVVRVNGEVAAEKAVFDAAAKSVRAEFPDNGREQVIEFFR